MFTKGWPSREVASTPVADLTSMSSIQDSSVTARSLRRAMTSSGAESGSFMNSLGRMRAKSELRTRRAACKFANHVALSLRKRKASRILGTEGKQLLSSRGARGLQKRDDSLD